MSNPNPATPGGDPIQQVIDQVTHPTGTEIKIPTGEVYRGQTPEEALNKLVEGRAEATRHIRTVEAERSALQVRVQELESERQRFQTPPAPSGVDPAIQEKYLRWAKDPTEQTKHDLAEILGVPADKAIPLLKEAIGGATVSKASDEFMMRVPNFPQTPQAASAMQQRLAQKYGQTIGATTADHLELTYHELVREGIIQPNPMVTQGVTGGSGTPIANIRGGGTMPNPTLDIIQQARTMPLEKLKEVIDRAQQSGMIR